ncbi:MAG TPA: hypothetical protein PK636_06880 [bacterium]|nr:hypothetical protein [bacterium]HPJ72390.1 hypothetical protein [bacterium]HPQ66128.1 hypothetical protein [bacterium]
MDYTMFFLLSGVCFLVFLVAALDLSRVIRKNSGTWQDLGLKADNETSPLMESAQEAPSADAVAVAAAPVDADGNLKRLELSQAPEILDMIVTHTDWDGIISGALLKHFSSLARIVVSTPRRLRIDLRNLGRSGDKPNRLFIADLGISSEFLPAIEDALMELKNGGTKVYWYDHHPWSPLSVDTARDSCADLIVDTNFRNAAEIVFDRILPGDEYSRKLMRLLLNQSVKEEEDWAAGWRHLITATQASGTFSEIADLIANLAANKPFSMTDKFRIARMIEEEKIYKAFAEDKHREEKTDGGLRFLVVDLRTFRTDPGKDGKPRRRFDRHTPPASIGYDIVKFHQPDFYIMVLRNDRLSIRGGVGNSFRVDLLGNLREVDGKPVQIAGHTYAAGVYLTVGLSSKLRSLWDWSLPREAESFIAEIKKRL